MTILILVVTLRSWTQTGFSTLVPLYYLDVLKGDPRMVGTLLAVFLGSGAVGTLMAGPIADRFGVGNYAVGVSCWRLRSRSRFYLLEASGLRGARRAWIRVDLDLYGDDRPCA